MPNQLVRASVYDVEDPLGLGRLRLMIPSARGDALTGWAEPMVPPAKSFRPKLGDVMWVFYENGDENKPVYSSTAEITANMLEATMVLASTIIVGTPGGKRFELNDSQVFAADENDQKVFSLSPGEDSFLQILTHAGDTVAAINATGDAVLNDLDQTGEHRLAGDKLLLDGQTFSDLLLQIPQGVLVYGSRSPTLTGLHSQFGVMEVDWSPENPVGKRMMMFTLTGQVSVSTSSGGIPWILRIRYTTDGSTPSNSSTLLRSWKFNTDSGAVEDFTVIDRWFPSGGVDQFKFLVTMEVNDADSTHLINSVTNISLYLTDVGTDDVPNVAQPNSGGGSTGGGGGDTGPPGGDGKLQKFVRIYNSVRCGTYKGGGSLIGAGANATQGYYSSTNGNQKAAIWFPTTIASDLNGVLSGNVDKVEVYLYANHWYYNSGGTAVIGFHSDTSGSVPGSYGSISGTAADVVAHGATHFPKPGGRWIDISSYARDAWRTGGKTGILLGPGTSGTDRIYYGAFNGPSQSNKPQLRISFRK